MNELLFFITTAVTFLSVILFYRLFGKIGIFIFVAVASILTNIEAIKCVDIFGLSVTLGTVLYGCNFLCTDILSENYGKESAKSAIKVALGAMIFATIALQLSLFFAPNSVDFASDSMHTVFSFAPRICIASVVMTFVSNTIDVHLFHFFGKHTKHIWVKNNGATMIAQLVDSIGFCAISYLGVFPLTDVIEITATLYAMKVIVALCDTPFLYWAKRIKEKSKDGYFITMNEQDID